MKKIIIFLLLTMDSNSTLNYTNLLKAEPICYREDFSQKCIAEKRSMDDIPMLPRIKEPTPIRLKVIPFRDDQKLKKMNNDLCIEQLCIEGNY